MTILKSVWVSRIGSIPSRKTFLRTVLASLILVVAGCKSHHGTLLRIGITPGPAEAILQSVQPALRQQGIELKVIHFSDYIQPDMALASNDLDANLYQNVPFLQQFNHDHQTRFVSVSRVYLPLMALYPGRTKSLAALGNGARIALPNDPVNHDRALLLLEKAGLLQLSHDPNGLSVKVTANPKNFNLVELDAAQLPRSLDDVDAAIINANFALDAGLNPSKGALFTEAQDSQYANVLATNDGTASDPTIKTLAKVLASPETRSFISAHYGGAVYPAE